MKTETHKIFLLKQKTSKIVLMYDLLKRIFSKLFYNLKVKVKMKLDTQQMYALIQLHSLNIAKFQIVCTTKICLDLQFLTSSSFSMLKLKFPQT